MRHAVVRAIRKVLRVPAVKRLLIETPLIYKVYLPWERTHPFDMAHGVDTSGYIGLDDLYPDPKLKGLVYPYGASQPSIIRRALGTLGDVSEYTFIDLGCGKARPALVATEFQFRGIQGVELSTPLAELARQNAAQFAKRYPDRREITIHNQNALEYRLPGGKLALFFYQSFGRPLLEEFLTRLETSLAAGHISHLFFVYYNATFGDALDSSPAFSRWFAETIPYKRGELGFGPDKADTVVIWQSTRGELPSPYPGREARIVPLGVWTASLAPG